MITQPMTREELAALVERYQLWANPTEPDSSAFRPEHAAALLTEVYRVRRLERHITALVARTRAALSRRTLDVEAVRIQVEAELAQAAAEDSQEVI